MKKLTACLAAILALAICLSAAAFALGEYEDTYSLISYWKDNGYPDDVGAVFSTDGSMERFTILLTNDNPEREEEIKAMLKTDEGLTFGKAMYSINDLQEIRDEIIKNYSEDIVQSCTVGWGTDGGFGENGNEYRVVVDVFPDVADSYANMFSELYGDRVVVESNGRIISGVDSSVVQTGGMSLFSGLGSSYYLVFLGVVVVGYLLLKKRNGKNGPDQDIDIDDDDDEDMY